MALRRINRRPASASSYEEEDRPRRDEDRRRDDDEEEERPRSSSAKHVGDDGEPEDVVTSGWGGYKQTKESMPSAFPYQFKITEEETLIKFLEAEPFATYKQHWADWMPRGEKLSYTCIGESCPICDEVAQKPDFKSCFNILNFRDPKHPVVETLAIGMTVGDIIYNYHKDEKTGPIDREDRYFAIHMSGDKKGRKQTNLRPVKSRDLEEDFHLEPLDDDDLEKYKKKMHDASDLPVTDKATLRKVARAATD